MLTPNQPWKPPSIVTAIDGDRRQGGARWKYYPAQMGLTPSGAPPDRLQDLHALESYLLTSITVP
jgi:hypothetical protein